MIADQHVHTSWSSDSETPAEEQIQKAIRLGMKNLCITEHQDFDAPTFPPDYFNFLIGDKGDDETVKAYFADLTALKEKYRDQISLQIGVEMGMQPHLANQLNDFAKKHPFDFIIGSTHSFDGLDAEDKRHYEGIEIEKAVENYFKQELLNLKSFHGYDIVGHMDFVLRYGPGAAESFTYAKYGEILDEILKTVIESGKGIECNTSKFKAKNMFNPNPAIIKRYAELGGEIITFGSDAHTSNRLGEGFTEAAEMVKSAGIQYYAVFKQHQPEFHKIG